MKWLVLPMAIAVAVLLTRRLRRHALQQSLQLDELDIPEFEPDQRQYLVDYLC
jgi:hypothetical protein